MDPNEKIRPDLSLAFTGNPLDRTEDKRGDPLWLQDALTRGEFLLCHDNRIAMRIDESSLGGMDIAWHSYADIASVLEDELDCVFLGLDKTGQPKFSLCLPTPNLPTRSPNSNIKFIDGRSIGMQLADPLLDNGKTGIIAQTLSILSWHKRHRFCANCATPTKVRRGGYQRVCPACQTEHYPRTDPVAIMLPVKGDYCLLGRQPRFPPGFFSALAGFVEAGESLEAAVRREVHEEAGIEIGHVHYVGSQPWPFPSNLMLAFLAQAVSDEIKIDRQELEEARWFSREEVKSAFNNKSEELKAPPPIAIAHHLIKRWLDET